MPVPKDIIREAIFGNPDIINPELFEKIERVALPFLDTEGKYPTREAFEHAWIDYTYDKLKHL